MKIRTTLTSTLVLLLAFTMPLVGEDQQANEAADQQDQQAVEPAEPESYDGFDNPVDRYSYALGINLGQMLDSGGMEISPEWLVQGINDIVTDSNRRLDDDQVRVTLMSFNEELKMKRIVEQEKQGKENLKKSEAFLEENKTKEGVVTTDSGLQYRVIAEGQGDSPKPSDTVAVHYRGKLINGKEFDSSYKRGEPAKFNVSSVIKGWTEALQLMKPGAKWELFIHPDLAYGQHSPPSIGPNQTLVFEVELLDVERTTMNNPAGNQPEE